MDFQIPRIVSEESDDHRGVFAIEPLDRGFGYTFGNSLRRVLLSSLEGAAVTAVKIEGVAHEFTTLPGVREDVTDIILNLKSLICRLHGESPEVEVHISKKGPGIVTAAPIESAKASRSVGWAEMGDGEASVVGIAVAGGRRAYSAAGAAGLQAPAAQPASGTGSVCSRCRSSSTATCIASRCAPSPIWWRQLVPSATTMAPGFARMAGSRLASAIFIDTSKWLAS